MHAAGPTAREYAAARRARRPAPITPDIAATLTRNRSIDRQHQGAPHSAPYENLKQQNAKLRRDIAELTEHLALAVAIIQRLTLENHRLRQERDEASPVSSIAGSPPPAALS